MTSGVRAGLHTGNAVDSAGDGLTDTKLAGKASAARTQRQAGKRIVVKVKVQAKERLTAKASGKIKVKPTYKLKSRTVQSARARPRR